jgi:4-amino-4-deoxy-L-arabinose transferase-like glycosyltransferase
MLYVSPIVEALRGRPRLVFWIATLTQALLWMLVPSLFYASPPGELPLTLAIGHEWQLGTVYGPPLGYWLAELAFRLTGGSAIGIYVLAQLCVIATYWAVFTLGRRIVGVSHAALAVLLMAGITVFAAPTPDFGPTVLAMPLSALSILFYWRAVGEARDRYWLFLGPTLGLLLLTTYFGAILFGLMAVFTAATGRGRARFKRFEPYVGVLVAVIVALPYLIWLTDGHTAPLALRSDWSLSASALQWGRQLAALVFDHAGLLVLVIVAAVLFVDRKAVVPEIVRQPIDPLAKPFVYTFALAPALIAAIVAALYGRDDPVGGEGVLVVLSGLAVIVLAGDVIRLYRQRAASLTWLALLLAPPLVAIVSVLVVPWTIALELKVNEPAAAMGRFFTESFNRRTGKPLAIVVGEGRLAGLVSLASPDRPSVFVDGSPERAPWITEAAFREKGAIIVWWITDAAGAPPAHLRARFPDLVAEVPRSFERPIQGRLPLLRIGWAMIRPSN